MRDLARGGLEYLALNWATVRERWSLAQTIDGCARRGVAGIAPWREPVQAMGAEAAGRRIRDAGLRVSGYCRAGLFPAADGAGLQAALEDNRRAIDEAAAIGAECLVMLGGGMPAGSKDLPLARSQARDGLAAVLPHARERAVPLAIEPLHPMYAADRCCVSTLKQANDLCEKLDPEGEGGIGVVVDVYHVFWDPELEHEVARAGAARRILAFHVCDWLVPTRDMLLDRGMMGDGVIDIPRIRGLVEDAGYAGLIEVEIFSKQDWWRRDPEEVLAVIAERYRTVV
jgi:sugar phosphate isomerase/epimerase